MDHIDHSDCDLTKTVCRSLSSGSIFRCCSRSSVFCEYVVWWLARWHGLCRSAPSPHACMCVCVCVCASSLQHKAGASDEAAAGPTNHNPLEKCCLPLYLFFYLTIPPSCHLSLSQPFYSFNLRLWLLMQLFFILNLCLPLSIGLPHVVSTSHSDCL